MDAGTLVPPGQNEATESYFPTEKPAFFGRKHVLRPTKRTFFRRNEATALAQIPG